tara:strand:+ start:674 stop:2080 length:1407 start_codon:yes stop_codon:yes gene_type:complete
MGGGLLQLASTGEQDVYLTGTPQITMWKLIYKRHTNFSMESIEQSFNSDLDFGKKIVCNVSRSGDLIHKVWLRLKLGDIVTKENQGTNSYRWARNIVCLIIKSLEVEIGGQVIDKHYGEWFDIYWKLMVPYSKSNVEVENDFMNLTTSNLPNIINKISQNYYIQNPGLGKKDYTPIANNDNVFVSKGGVFYIPLNFWFCRNPGLALPVIALQHHEVKFNLELRNIEELVVNNSNTIKKFDGIFPEPKNGYEKPTISGNFWIDYIFIDTEERRKFALSNHEYLIEQLQYNEGKSIDRDTNYCSAELNFKHPIKELFWTITPSEYCSYPKTDNFFMYSNEFGNFESHLESAKITFNGHDRIKERDEQYFRWVQPYQHHTKITGLHINSYSFALKPEEHQPTGTCNFSRIDNAYLHVNLNSGHQTQEEYSGSNSEIKNLSYTEGSFVLKVFAWNYNILRISSGMGGLLYSN